MNVIDVTLIVLVLAWLGGFSLHLGGRLIHLLLVIAVVVFATRLLNVSI